MQLHGLADKYLEHTVHGMTCFVGVPLFKDGWPMKRFVPPVVEYSLSKNYCVSMKFADTVRAAVRSIPKGETRSYKEVATAAGNPNAARAVGMIMSKNFDTSVPCHRVVRSDGKIGGYNRGGAETKRNILEHERSNF